LILHIGSAVLVLTASIIVSILAAHRQLSADIIETRLLQKLEFLDQDHLYGAGADMAYTPEIVLKT